MADVISLETLLQRSDIIFQSVDLEELIELFTSAKSKEDPFYELGHNEQFLKFKLVSDFRVESKRLQKLTLKELIAFARETMWESRLERTRGWLEQYDVQTSIEELKHLTTLNLDNNEISDITPLKDLKNLIYLNLDNNEISDVSPLKDLKNLTYLNLSGNEFSDVTPLQGLKNLTYLGLGSNEISDASPLKGLTNLTHLYLRDTEISEVSIKELNLKATIYAGSSYW